MDLTGRLDDTRDDLIERAVAGDEAAFARIVAAHHDAMTRVCFVVCGDIDDADEAVNAAWSIAWRRMRDVREPDRLRSWLVTIAANEARRVSRRDRRRPVYQLDLAADVPSRSGDPANRPQDLDLVNALARLDLEDRRLLALRYVAGFDSFELAKATGRSASGTRARLARLLDRLRKDLADD